VKPIFWGFCISPENIHFRNFTFELSGVIKVGYKGVVKDGVVILEQDVELPEGAEVEVILKGWWLSEEAKQNATDKKAFKKLIEECNKLREQMPETTDSVKIIREMREARANR
jgi:predicted DNA-binding antitoxin AbrB/MazE fold protein